jgi:Zn-dependent metalloprotease
MKAIRLSLINFILLFSIENHFATVLTSWSVEAYERRNLGSREQDPLTIANQYIQSHLADWGLLPRDIAELDILNRYTDVNSGITRIYFQQKFNGIPIHNAILNMNISKDGKVFYRVIAWYPGLMIR